MRFVNPKVAAAYAAQSANPYPKPRPSTGGPRAAGSTGSGTMGGVGPRPAGGMPAFAKPYTAAALASMNSTNSGTPKSGTGPKPGFGAAVKQMGLGTGMGMKKMAGAGAALGKSLGMKSGGKASSASKRADGIATKGKTKGKMMSKGGKTC